MCADVQLARQWAVPVRDTRGVRQEDATRAEGGEIDSSSLVDLAEGIYDGLVRARVFGMAYNDDDGGRSSGRCRPYRTTPPATGGSISEGSDGVIVTIATEGPDAGGAGPPWWRTEVDAHWAEPGGEWGKRGGSVRRRLAAVFAVRSTRTLACAGVALSIGVM